MISVSGTENPGLAYTQRKMQLQTRLPMFARFLFPFVVFASSALKV
jgi:hypothetical protein